MGWGGGGGDEGFCQKGPPGGIVKDLKCWIQGHTFQNYAREACPWTVLKALHDQAFKHS